MAAWMLERRRCVADMLVLLEYVLACNGHGARAARWAAADQVTLIFTFGGLSDALIVADRANSDPYG